MIIDLLIPHSISRRLDVPHLVVAKHGKLLHANEAFAAKVGYASVKSLLADQDRVFADEQSRLLWVKSHAKVKHRQGYRLCFSRKQKGGPRGADGAAGTERTTLWMRCLSWKHKVGADFVLECLLEDVSTEVESEGGYQRLFEGLPVPCHEIGPRGLLTFVNDAELELLGHTREEAGSLLGRPVWQRLMPQDRTESRKMVRKKMAGVCKLGGQPIYRNYRHKDGSSIPVRIEDKFSLEPKGQRTRIVSTLADLRLPQDLVLVLQRKNIMNSPLIADLPIYAFSKNRAHEVQSANKRWKQEAWKRVGQEVELGFMTDKDLYPAYLARQYVADDQRVMRSRQALQKIEKHVFAGEKSASVVQVVKLPRLNAHGRVVGVQGFFWRVEDSERVQRELAKWFTERVDEAFNETFNRLASPAFRASMEGQLFYANDALGRLLGCGSGEDLVSRWDGRNWTQRIQDPVLRTQFQGEIGSERQRVEDFHYPVVQASGAVIWVAESSSVVRPAGDESIKYVEGFIHDIDEVKRSEQRYWNLFDNSQDVIYTHTAGEPFQFTSINPAGTRLSGYEKDEFLKLKLENLIHPDSLGLVRMQFALKIANPDQMREPYEADIMTKQGKTRPLLIHSFVRKDNFGAVEEIVGVCQDLTERDRMQDDLKAQQNKEWALEDYIREQGKMESAGNMINVVTHDLVTLHQTIRQEGRILADYIRRTKDIPIDLVHDSLENMLNTVGRASELVRRLKALKGVRLVKIHECSVSDLVRRSWTQVKPTVPETIGYSEDFDLNADVARLDADWLQSCLINIFENSVYELEEMEKQRGKDGLPPREKWIHVKTTSGQSELGNDCLVIEVSDSGRGADDETLARMFDPCFSMKPDGEGLGLGLAEAKKCVMAHGGEILACNGASGGLIITMKFLKPDYDDAEKTRAAD